MLSIPSLLVRGLIQLTSKVELIYICNFFVGYFVNGKIPNSRERAGE